MLPFFGGNDCRNLSGSTENEHTCKNIMKFYGLFLPIKRCLKIEERIHQMSNLKLNLKTRYIDLPAPWPGFTDLY